MKGAELRIAVSYIIPENKETEIAPAEVFVGICSYSNNKDKDANSSITAIKDAITYMINKLSNIYSQEVITDALSTLFNINPVPLLIMRATILCFQRYPTTKPILVDLLKGAFERKIWTQDHRIWVGVINFLTLKDCQPEGIDLLATLPPEQIRDVISQVPSIEGQLKDAVRIFEINNSK